MFTMTSPSSTILDEHSWTLLVLLFATSFSYMCVSRVMHVMMVSRDGILNCMPFPLQCDMVPVALT